jgi:pimeloyl-ACP methyl ester carboxylesterase
MRNTGIGSACCAWALALSAAYQVYHPKRLPLRRGPAADGIAATAVRIPVPRSRVSLQAWYLPVPGATRSVVVGHGIGRHKGFSWPYAAFLYRAGLNVLVFDHRNHGESDADPAFWGMARRFTDDMDAAVSWLRARHDGPVSILTFSFSTFPALYVLQRPGTSVDAIVCDSGPCLDIDSLSHRFIAAGRKFLPDWLARPDTFELFRAAYARAVRWMLQVRQWPPDLSGTSTRLLFIANEHDAIVPAIDVVKFADLYKGSGCWEVTGASHLAAFKTDPTTYSRVVLEFLNR